MRFRSISHNALPQNNNQIQYNAQSLQMAVSGWAFTKIDKMTYEIKRLKKELKEWKSKEVKERFERVNSQLHLVAINEIEHKIKRLKRGEDI